MRLGSAHVLMLHRCSTTRALLLLLQGDSAAQPGACEPSQCNAVNCNENVTDLCDLAGAQVVCGSQCSSHMA